MAWSLWKALGLGDDFSLSHHLGWDRNPYLTAKSHELFPGVAKPSHILVGMAISYMQKDLKSIISTRERPTHYYGAGYMWTNGKVKIWWEWSGHHIGNIILCLGDDAFPLSEEEKDKLSSAIKTAMAWKRDYDKHLEENKRQEKATDLIEEFFKPKVEALPAPDVPASTTDAKAGDRTLDEIFLCHSPACIDDCCDGACFDAAYGSPPQRRTISRVSKTGEKIPTKRVSRKASGPEASSGTQLTSL